MGPFLAALQEETRKEAKEEGRKEEGKERIHTIPSSTAAIQDRFAARERRILFETKGEGGEEEENEEAAKGIISQIVQRGSMLKCKAHDTDISSFFISLFTFYT